jgi:hypothetical protein
LLRLLFKIKLVFNEEIIVSSDILFVFPIW